MQHSKRRAGALRHTTAAQQGHCHQSSASPPALHSDILNVKNEGRSRRDDAASAALACSRNGSDRRQLVFAWRTLLLHTGAPMTGLHAAKRGATTGAQQQQQQQQGVLC